MAGSQKERPAGCPRRPFLFRFVLPGRYFVPALPAAEAGFFRYFSYQPR